MPLKIKIPLLSGFFLHSFIGMITSQRHDLSDSPTT